MVGRSDEAKGEGVELTYQVNLELKLKLDASKNKQPEKVDRTRTSRPISKFIDVSVDSVTGNSSTFLLVPA